MAETDRPPEGEPPVGPPDFGWFDGVVDGRISDAVALRSVHRRWNDLGVGDALLEIRGGRFSFLPGDGVVRGEALDTSQQEQVLAILEEMAADATLAGSVESTLRCTMVYGDRVVETLFRPVGEGWRSASRTRPTAPADLERRPRAEVLPESVRAIGLRRGLLVLVLLLVVFSATAWRTGWIDRALAVAAKELDRDPGPFEGLLEIEVESRWGVYEVRLSRGADYPTAPDAEEALLEGADAARRAAVDVVAEGSSVYVQLVDASGEVLEEERTELRPLIVEEEGEAETELPGRAGGAGVRLSLASGIDEP